MMTMLYNHANHASYVCCCVALFSVVGCFRTLHELEGELQREDAEDMGRSSGGGRRDRGSSHGSSGAASGSAPSGLDDDSTLWNIQAESSEEN
jgi:hypothetical protein